MSAGGYRFRRPLTPKLAQRYPIRVFVTRRKIPTGENFAYQVPNTASNYDVETEHEYIMAKALRSYEEHTTDEGTSGVNGGSSVVARPGSKTSLVKPRAQSAHTTRAPANSLASPPRSTTSNASPQKAVNHPASQQNHVAGAAPSPSQSPSPSPSRRAHRRQIQSAHPRVHTSPHRPPASSPAMGSPIRIPSPGGSADDAPPNGNPHGTLQGNHHPRGSRPSSVDSTGSDRRSRQPLPTSRISLGLPAKNKLRVSMDRDNKSHKANGPTSRSVDASPVKPSPAAAGGGGHSGGGGGDGGSRRPATDISCFNSIRSPRKQYFTIHPEWVSESLSVQKMSLGGRSTQSARQVDRSNGGGAATAPRRSATLGREGVGGAGGYDARRSRRCKSAPPPRTRNPITWERPDISGRSKSFKRQTFVVHPEWSSENPNAKKTPRPPMSQPKPTLENRYHTFPPRRCHSAPPVRTRNPITWENYNVQGR